MISYLPYQHHYFIIYTKAPTDTLEPPTSCSDSELLLTLNLLTDCCPLETFWTLRNMCTGEFQQAKEEGHYSNADTSYVETYCVPNAAYEFWIFDRHGDGICCAQGSGSYSVTYGGEEVAYGGEFESTEATSFGACASVPSLVSSSMVLVLVYVIRFRDILFTLSTPIDHHIHKGSYRYSRATHVLLRF